MKWNSLSEFYIFRVVKYKPLWQWYFHSKHFKIYAQPNIQHIEKIRKNYKAFLQLGPTSSTFQRTIPSCTSLPTRSCSVSSSGITITGTMTVGAKCLGTRGFDASGLEGFRCFSNTKAQCMLMNSMAPRYSASDVRSTMKKFLKWLYFVLNLMTKTITILMCYIKFKSFLSLFL